MKIDYDDLPKVEQFNLFPDERGFFSPTLLKNSWCQSNISFNEKAFVFRGLHFQEGSYAQAKTVQVYAGKIVDIILDIRPESTTFGEMESFELDPGNFITVPRGYAHSFLTLEPGTIVQYFVDNKYSPKHEGSIAWNSIEEVEDIVLQLCEDYSKTLIISQKDKDAESWENFKQRVLPD